MLHKLQYCSIRMMKLWDTWVERGGGRRTENHRNSCPKRSFVLPRPNGIPSDEHALCDQDTDTTDHAACDEFGSTDAIDDEHRERAGYEGARDPRSPECELSAKAVS